MMSNRSHSYDVAPKPSFTKTFDRVYNLREGQAVSPAINPQEIALVYMVMAQGTLYNIEMPFRDPSAEGFLHLAQSALVKGEFLATSTVAGLQTLVRLFLPIEIQRSNGTNSYLVPNGALPSVCCLPCALLWHRLIHFLQRIRQGAAGRHGMDPMGSSDALDSSSMSPVPVIPNTQTNKTYRWECTETAHAGSFPTMWLKRDAKYSGNATRRMCSKRIASRDRKTN